LFSFQAASSIPEFSFIKPLFIVGGSGSSDPFPYNNDEIARMSKTALERYASENDSYANGNASTHFTIPS